MCQVGMVVAVVSPLDLVTQELQDMRETVNSVQASLITSVSLIQDQLNEFTENIKTKFESQLTSLDNKVSDIGTNMGSLTARSHLWDSFHLHIEAWNSQLTSLEQKIEIMKRSQEEKLSENLQKVSTLPDLNIKIEKLGLQLKDMGGQLVVMDRRLVSLQDKVAGGDKVCQQTSQSFRNMETLIKSLNNSQHHARHRHKVDQIYSHLITNRRGPIQQDSPRFDFLRSNPPPTDDGIITLDEDSNKEDFGTAEDKLLSLFRKIATPFKRVNKRLMTMETIQDKIEAEISNIKTGLQNSSGDLMRQISDFFTTSTEMSQEQNRLIEKYATNFGQCCSGQGAELEKFLVTSGTLLDRIDRWSSNWQNLASQKFDKHGQQNSYDHDTLVKGQKVIESLLVKAIDKCRFVGGNRLMKRTTTKRPTTTTTTTTKTENIRVEVTENQALALPGSLYTSNQEEDEEIDEEEGEEVEIDEEGEEIEVEGEEKDEVLLSGCLNQSKSGTVKVGPPNLNEDGRDFHLRLCDQETNGGGWTVGGSMSSSVPIFVIVCMLGCWCC